MVGDWSHDTELKHAIPRNEVSLRWSAEAKENTETSDVITFMYKYKEREKQTDKRSRQIKLR